MRTEEFIAAVEASVKENLNELIRHFVNGSKTIFTFMLFQSEIQPQRSLLYCRCNFCLFFTLYLFHNTFNPNNKNNIRSPHVLMTTSSSLEVETNS